MPQEMVDAFLRMLAPFAPHVAEEMWSATWAARASPRTRAWPT